MIKKIYKYEISPDNIVTLNLPFGAELLSVQNQNEHVCLWALVNPKNTVVKRYFKVFSTGESINLDVNYDYIGTFQLQNGSLVFHLFEILESN